MKRVLTIILSLSFLCVTVYAQKPAQGSFLTEAELNLSSLDRNGDLSVSNFELPTLRGRYFIQEDLALRVDLSIQNLKISTDVYENSDGTGGTGTEQGKISGFGFGLGIEKHLAGTNKLSPFIGAGISYGTFSITQETTDVNNGGSYQDGFSSTSEQKASAIGVVFFLGGDYWVNNSLYLGTQINIGVSNQKFNDGTSKTSFGGTTTESVEAGSKSFFYGVEIIPSFRIGFAIPSN